MYVSSVYIYDWFSLFLHQLKRMIGVSAEKMAKMFEDTSWLPGFASTNYVQRTFVRIGFMLINNPILSVWLEQTGKRL